MPLFDNGRFLGGRGEVGDGVTAPLLGRGWFEAIPYQGNIFPCPRLDGLMVLQWHGLVTQYNTVLGKGGLFIVLNYDIYSLFRESVLAPFPLPLDDLQWY